MTSIRYRRFDGESCEADIRIEDGVLDLSRRNIRSIDLTPLAGFTELQKLDLYRNPIPSLDVTSLFFCPNLRSLSLDSSIPLEALYVPMTIEHPAALHPKALFGRTGWQYGLQKIYWNLSDQLGKRAWHRLRGQLDSIIPHMNAVQKQELKAVFLESLDLHHFVGLDCEVEDLTAGIGERDSFEKIRGTLKQSCYRLLNQQLENGGPTIFIDVELLRSESDRDPGCALAAARVLERRETEMESLAVQQTIGKGVDLSPIWITAYGFKVLRTLNAGLNAKKGQFLEIEQAFSALGYPIRVARGIGRVHLPVKISQGLRDYVLFIANHYSSRHSPV